MNYITFFKGDKDSNKHHEFLSNFFKHEFMAPDFKGKMQKFYYGEQYFMYLKSLEFQDFETAKQILEHPELGPVGFKKLGRQLKNYKTYGPNWEKVKVSVMVKVQIYKYKSEDMRQRLLETGDTLLIEASPYDQYWGAGMYAANINQGNYKNLTGKNMLGKILTALRDKNLKKG